MTPHHHMTAPLDASVYRFLSKTTVDEIAASFGAGISIEIGDDAVVFTITSRSALEIQNALTQAAIACALTS